MKPINKDIGCKLPAIENHAKLAVHCKFGTASLEMVLFELHFLGIV